GLVALRLLWNADAGRRAAHLALFAAAPMVSALAWFGYFYSIYGTPDPRAPYGEAPNTSLAFVPGGWLGLFFDNQFGLLTYSPVLAAAMVGLVVGGPSRERAIARALAGVAAAYLAATAFYWMWWAGVPASPARFAAASLPIFGLPAALAWRAAIPAGRALFAAAAAMSVA